MPLDIKLALERYCFLALLPMSNALLEISSILLEMSCVLLGITSFCWKWQALGRQVGPGMAVSRALGCYRALWLWQFRTERCSCFVGDVKSFVGNVKGSVGNVRRSAGRGKRFLVKVKRFAGNVRHSHKNQFKNWCQEASEAPKIESKSVTDASPNTPWRPRALR